MQPIEINLWKTWINSIRNPSSEKTLVFRGLSYESLFESKNGEVLPLYLTAAFTVLYMFLIAFTYLELTFSCTNF